MQSGVDDTVGDTPASAAPGQAAIARPGVPQRLTPPAFTSPCVCFTEGPTSQNPLNPGHTGTAAHWTQQLLRVKTKGPRTSRERMPTMSRYQHVAPPTSSPLPGPHALCPSHTGLPAGPEHAVFLTRGPRSCCSLPLELVFSLMSTVLSPSLPLVSAYVQAHRSGCRT